MKFRISLAAASACLVLSASSSFAANRVWIGQCGTLGSSAWNGTPAQVCAIPFLANSGELDATTSKSVTVTSNTILVRICTESQIAVKGAAGVAITDAVMFGGQCEYFGVQPGSTISVIANP